MPSVPHYPRCLKKREISTILEFDEIRRGSSISRDDSNGEVRFVIRDLEKFRVILPKLPFYLFLENSNFLGSYILHFPTPYFSLHPSPITIPYPTTPPLSSPSPNRFLPPPPLLSFPFLSFPSLLSRSLYSSSSSLIPFSFSSHPPFF